jgi:hypothetical protein
MTNITAIIVAKRKNSVLKVKYTDDLSKRMKKYSNLSDFEMFEMIMLPEPMSKLKALQYIVSLPEMSRDEVQTLLTTKISRYEMRENKHEYKLVLTNKSVKNDISAEDLLEAIK